MAWIWLKVEKIIKKCVGKNLKNGWDNTSNRIVVNYKIEEKTKIKTLINSKRQSIY